MCVRCRQWGASARSLWDEVFDLVERFDALVEKLPPPVKASASAVQQGLPRYRYVFALAAGMLEARCPLIFVGEAAAIESSRSQMIDSGREWLDIVRANVELAEGFLAQQTARAEPMPLVIPGLMSGFARMNDMTARTIQAIEAGNRATWERDVLLRSGPPFVQLWSWPGPAWPGSGLF